MQKNAFLIWHSCWLALFLVAGATATAGDWPQILGPERDGKAQNESLQTEWPANGPARRWEAKIGDGYAGAVVQGDTVVVFHRVGDVERLEALAVSDGASKWTADFPASYRPSINPDVGPRCTPLIHQGRVYGFGAAGDLYCVDLKSGEKRWTRALYADYNGDEGYFGAGSSPIIVDDKLLVNVGGRDDAGIVAVALDTGKTVWKIGGERASYSSPAVAQIQGRTTVVFVTRLNAVGVDPSNGEVRFRVPFGKQGPTVNAATPVIFDNQVFLSASYGIGALLIKIPATGAPQSVWSNEVISSQYSTSIYLDGYLFGVDGREDGGPGRLVCVNARTGREVWAEANFSIANLILADGKLLVVKADGGLELVVPSPEGYRRLASASLPEARSAEIVTRALPALSNGRLFVRISDRRNSKLICLQVGK